MNADTTSQVHAIGATIAETEEENTALFSDFCALVDSCVESLTTARKRIFDSAPPTTKRVLLVDDDANVLRSYRRMLLQVADFVDIAATVGEAANKLEEREYDTLVVDYQLTNGTAAHLIRRARAGWARRPQVYAILISGRLTASAGGELARQIGANDWLAKPCDPLVLQDRVIKGFAAQERIKRVQA